MAALVDKTIDEFSTYLTRGYWDYTNYYYHSFSMADDGGGTVGNDGVLYYNYSGFTDVNAAGSDPDGLSAERRVLIDTALDYLGSVLGIQFVETEDQGYPWPVDLFFKDNEPGAYANTDEFGFGNGDVDHRYTHYAWVNIEPEWAGGLSAVKTYTYQTVIHEILHTLGLGHPGPYNADGTDTYEPVYVTDSNDAATDASNNALNDSWQMTIMSYFDQGQNTSVDADVIYLITPGVADFEALRFYYGSSAYIGDTVYGFNTNIAEGILSDLSDHADGSAFTLIDDGGNDTVDFSGYSADQKIDLTVVSGASTGIFSNVGGLTGNMALAVGTLIENALGGSGNDEIIGNGAANKLTGKAGNDRIAGKGGGDTIDGGEGTDTVIYDGVRTEYDQDLQIDGTIFLFDSTDTMDLLFGIERIEMADGAYLFDMDSANVGFTYRLYGAGYGRTPDEGGLRYWTGILDDLDANNPDMDKRDFLAEQFLAADEFVTLYGANSSNEDYVDAMYQNVLHRAPDQGGYDFWVGAMEAGLGRDDILVHFADSIENRLNADLDYDDGIWVV